MARVNIPAVGDRVEELNIDLAVCAIVHLEVLFSARNLTEYNAIAIELRQFRDVPITPRVMERALEVQRSLAARARHRLSIPDLVIAAAAESAGLTVLHYDADFERIAEVTGQPQEWVVPRGTV